MNEKGAGDEVKQLRARNYPMDLSRSSIICLSLLLVGLCLQFCFGGATAPAIFGSLIVILGPRIASHNYERDFWFRTGNGEMYDGKRTEKWMTFDAETAVQHIQSLSNGNSTVVMRKKTTLDAVLGWMGCLGLRGIGILVGGVCFLSGLDSGHPEPFGNYLACAFIALPHIPFNLIELKYGCASPFTSKTLYAISGNRRKLEAIEVILQKSLSHTEFTMQGQFLLERKQWTEVTDAKTTLRFAKNYRRVLCTMVSIAMNEVRLIKFPYAYYVIVIKGTEDPNILADLLALTQNTAFMPQHKIDDGNTIYVITKDASTSIPYCTTDKDIEDLLQIIARSADVLERNFGVE